MKWFILKKYVSLNRVDNVLEFSPTFEIPRVVLYRNLGTEHRKEETFVVFLWVPLFNYSSPLWSPVTHGLGTQLTGQWWGSRNWLSQPIRALLWELSIMTEDDSSNGFTHVETASCWESGWRHCTKSRWEAVICTELKKQNKLQRKTVSQEGSSALSTSRLFQSSYSSVIDSRTFWQYPVLLYQPCPSKGNSSWFRLLSTKNTSLLNWFCWTRLETIMKKPFQLMRLLLYELVAWLPKGMA